MWFPIEVPMAEVFPGDIANSPHSRVNYVNPSLHKLCIISSAFEIYHALKIGLRFEVDSAQCTKKFGEIYRVAHKLAQEFLHSHAHIFNHNSTDRPMQPVSSSSSSSATHINTFDAVRINVAGSSDSEAETAASSDWDLPQIIEPQEPGNPPSCWDAGLVA